MKALDVAAVQCINGRRVFSMPAVIRGFKARRGYASDAPVSPVAPTGSPDQK